jgi:hypothetical protein
LDNTAIRLFARQGYDLVPTPPTRTPGPADPILSGDPADGSLWALARFPGTAGWTVIKTAPLELLCARPTGTNRPWLAALAAELACDGFQLNLYDGDSLVLLEADPSGHVAVSGLNTLQDDDPFSLHDERIPDGNDEAGFRSLNVPDDLRAALAGFFSEAAAKSVGRLLCAERFAYWDNLLQVEVLTAHEDLSHWTNAEQPDSPRLLDQGRALYFRRT